jgi:hypothetical protein
LVVEVVEVGALHPTKPLHEAVLVVAQEQVLSTFQQHLCQGQYQ